MASEITGIPAPRWHAPPGLLKGLAAGMSVIERLIPVPPDFASETLRELAGTTCLGGNARARPELGWDVRELRVGWSETVRHEYGCFLRRTGR